MPSFTFDRAFDISRASKYLATFDDTVKFTLTLGSAEQVLYATTASVHPFCFTDFSFHTVATAPPAKRLAREEEKVGWSINSDLLVRVLACFDPILPLTLEIEEDSSFLLLLQQSPNHDVTRVMRIGVMHDLGPSLTVDHGIDELYRIHDIDSFRQVARSATVSDDPTCHISLYWGKENQCYLRIASEFVEFRVHLGTLARRPLAAYEGRVQAADLESFGLLCGRGCSMPAAQAQKQLGHLHRGATPSPQCEGQQLSIGFGDNGLSLLRIRWFSPDGESTANLFFCTG